MGLTILGRLDLARRIFNILVADDNLLRDDISLYSYAVTQPSDPMLLKNWISSKLYSHTQPSIHQHVATSHKPSPA
jgi:hypothetical protein